MAGALETFGLLVSTRRGGALAAVLGITLALAAAGLPRLAVDNSNEGTFRPGDPVVEDYRELKRVFGNDEFVVVSLEAPAGGAFSRRGSGRGFPSPGDDVFTPAFLETLGACERALGKVRHVTKTTSLRTVRYVEGRDDEVRTRPFLPSAAAVVEGRPLDAWRAVALAHPRYAATYVSGDARIAAIVLETDVPDEDNEGKLLLARDLREILAEPRFAAHAPRMAGAPVFEADFDERTGREGGTFFVLSLVVSGAFLAATLRSARAAATTLGVSLLATVATLALVGLSGEKVSMYSVILPSLLLTVGVADAVHLIEGAREHGVAASYRLHGAACAVTALTTAAGFLSFATSDVRPLQVLGVFAGAGVMLCFVFALALAPWAVGAGTGGDSSASTSTSTGAEERGGMLARLASASVRRSGLVLGVAVVLLGLSLAGMSRLKVDTFWLDAFKESTPLRQEFAYVDARLDGTFSLEVVVDGGAAGALEEPALLARIARFEQRLRADASGVVGSVYGPPDLVAEVHAAFAPSTTALPATRALVAQEMLVLDAKDVKEVVDFERRLGRVHVRVKARPSSVYLALIGRVRAAAEAEGLSVRTSGFTQLFAVLATYVTQSQIQGFAGAFIAIAALLSLLLRSVRLGLLALVPNLFPVAATLGLMGALGVPLDIITVLVSSLALGISDDDTVHFFTHFRRAREEGHAPDEAARRTAAELARPAAALSAALCAGFLVFCASGAQHIARFGLVSATAIALAFATEMVLTPALLARFAGRK